MLDQLVILTAHLKQSLIALGYSLPPAMSFHNNKIKQIHMDFGHMSSVLCGMCKDNLFQNATMVFTKLTAERITISNFNQLLCNAVIVCDYVSSY